MSASDDDLAVNEDEYRVLDSWWGKWSDCETCGSNVEEVELVFYDGKYRVEERVGCYGGSASEWDDESSARAAFKAMVDGLRDGEGQS